MYRVLEDILASVSEKHAALFDAVLFGQATGQAAVAPRLEIAGVVVEEIRGERC